MYCRVTQPSQDLKRAIYSGVRRTISTAIILTTQAAFACVVWIVFVSHHATFLPVAACAHSVFPQVKRNKTKPLNQAWQYTGPAESDP